MAQSQVQGSERQVEAVCRWTQSESSEEASRASMARVETAAVEGGASFFKIFFIRACPARSRRQTTTTTEVPTERFKIATN